MITADQFVAWFEQCFSNSYQVVLIAGGAEPLYLPAFESSPARIVFREDFLSSALHEVSHWLLAGESRRQLEDYGYWYEPDNRNRMQQQRFEAVEVKPQAIEAALHICLGVPFRVSVDNLALPDYDASGFSCRVNAQLRHYCASGLPQRAELFCQFLLLQRSLNVDLYDYLENALNENCGR